MKALAQGLVKGKIDGVAGSVSLTWVQPRVLDATQLGSMLDKIGGWVSSVGSMEVFSDLFLERKKKIIDDGKEQHVVDGSPDIFPHSHSYHVPIFTLSISILEVSFVLDKMFPHKIHK